ncbi:alpha/beta fold hydrolase [Aureibacillus halotolerans]|uniref:Proline iminopeptidase n=1 Tax=Aureibacillus halotolerans TaxID=1508390 RepID=A0A4R6U3V0_9BACI|nr:alpha/beta hydrolase [Aureibacillus halotolerans]TDQ41168.1 proline iminopeptidase [Aureibacillus halotolerans]
MSWKRELVETNRGTFEVFVKGAGQPVCVTHHYSEFNETGDFFAEGFIDTHKVYLVNLREAGASASAEHAYQFSMIEAVYDLESIREAIGYSAWTFAGHSTGGMIGILYGIHFSESLDALLIVGAAARAYMDAPECIYHQDHAKFSIMQHYLEKLKCPELPQEERKTITRERTKLSLYHPEQYDTCFSPLITKSICAARLDFFAREMMTFDVTRQLYRVMTKTIIFCGVHDVQCPIAFSEEMHDFVANSQFYRFEHSNHYPFLEEKNRFHDLIKQV